MAKISYPIHPPSIADLRRMGLTGIHVTCTGPSCQHGGVVAWDRLLLSEETAFPEIRSRRRFRCQHCGSVSVHIIPDWSAYQASGRGQALT